MLLVKLVKKFHLHKADVIIKPIKASVFATQEPVSQLKTQMD